MIYLHTAHSLELQTENTLNKGTFPLCAPAFWKSLLSCREDAANCLKRLEQHYQVTKPTLCFSTKFGGLYPILVSSPAFAAGRVSFCPRQRKRLLQVRINQQRAEGRFGWAFLRNYLIKIPAVYVPGSGDFVKQESEKSCSCT